MRVWDTATGRQIVAIKAMLDRITSGVVAPTASAVPALAPPSTVLAVDASDTAIDLAWTAAPGAASYEVFRSARTDLTFRPIATVGSLSYGDAGLEPATEYRYQVRASNGGATSDLGVTAVLPACAKTVCVSGS